MSTVRALISRDAIEHNFARIKAQAPDSKILAVLKANAYGHGLLAMAKTLTDADAIGVARLEEALALRAGGIVTPLLLLEGFFDASDLPVLVTNNIQTVIHHEQQLLALERANLSGPLTVWLKVDTGMCRLGVRPEEFDEFYRRLLRIPAVVQPPVLMSHFACADDVDDPMTNRQLALFHALVKDLPGERSLANSAAMLAWPDARADWVRPGLLLYGCSPLLGKTAAELGFIPAMTLTSRVISVHPMAKGQTVGYGAAWQATTDTWLAVVAIGYGDGYPRHARSGTPVLINGHRYPLVGRVSMDMITVEIKDPSAVACGDEVTLWGPELPVDEIAHWADTISYELILQLTSRVEMHRV